jgi:phage-related protein
VEWYFDAKGRSVAQEYYKSTSLEQKTRFYVLIKRIGDFGLILDKTKFINEGDGIYAFKPQPDRYLSFFTDERKIIITNAYTKKTDKMPINEKKQALKYRKDYFERKTGGQ